jgi:late competence protein required for DNA uptake (superfamily II DNA/RNA helicase)
MFKKQSSSNRNNITRGTGGARKTGGPRTTSAPKSASNAAFTGVYGGSLNKGATSAHSAPRSSSAPSTRASVYGGSSSSRSSYSAPAHSGHSYNSRASSRDGASFGGGYSSGPSRGGYSGSSSSSRGGYAGGGASRFGGSRSGGNSSGSRFGGNGGRGGFGGGNRGRGRASSGGRLDISRFINKAVVGEKVEAYVPEHTFADFKIEESLKKSVIAKGYITPSPIQDKTIPHILNGEDLVGIANTGTGKTAAFLLPLINKVIKNPDEQAIIMAPTRELAIQIDQELQSFIKGMKIYSVCCVGGAPIGRQISELKYFNNFIIGTPGRLKDLIDRKKLNLSHFKNLVLDEADRMLDMGFINDMKYVMSLMPKDRQTLFFSATLSPDIERIINDFLNNPVRISVKTRDTAKNVDQDVVYVRGGQKIDILHDLLINPEFQKVIIFGRTKHGVEKLTTMLSERGFKAASIHGDKVHTQRQRALKAFKDGEVQMLVATDVAARGLDIPNVSHVINYELPETHDDYVHRIGRTGRSDKTGKALTFVD